MCPTTGNFSWINIFPSSKHHILEVHFIPKTIALSCPLRQAIYFKRNALDFGNDFLDPLTSGHFLIIILTTSTLLTSNTSSLSYYALCWLALGLLSWLKGEARKWLIALIKRDISHFQACIKESNHPHSPFSTDTTLSSFSLLLSFYPPPTSHKNHSMMT